MTLRPGDWPRVRKVFEQALALPEPERAKYVAAACGTDAEVRREVERMLESHGRTEGFLSTPVAPIASNAAVMRGIEGEHVGPYLITSYIGAGGMGEVYRARDSRLKRDVALKILPSRFENEPDRLARFEREAQALAALIHPNIAAIHGFEIAGERRALVLEFVDGETLAERLDRGAVAVAEALAIARQVAVALEAAHEQGVIHRDLKPSNIKITPEGVVKILDFGLAKLVAPTDASASTTALPGPDSGGSLSPTRALDLTGSGVVLGTAAYMAPEQARGKAVDKRADIWSFGAVLYEMLTGTRAFDGETANDILGAVIHKDLDYARLPANLSQPVHVVLRRCLQKDPKERLRDMGDVRLALDGAFLSQAATADRTGLTRRRVFELVVTACLAAIGGAAAVWSIQDAPADRRAIRFEILSPGTTPGGVAMSPDGRQIAFLARDEAGTSRLHVHSLETGETRQIAPAERGPFWSPNSLAVVIAAEGKLKRLDLAGGPAVTLCDVGDFRGGTWTSDDVILFADGSKRGILQIAATGGTPVQRTMVDPARDESFHSFPWALPGGRHFLYLRETTTPGSAGLYVGRLDAKPEGQDVTLLLRSRSRVAYVPPTDSGTGYLLFIRDGALIAQAFDTQSLGLGAEIGRVAEDTVAFGVSAGGEVAYVRNPSRSGALVWVDRAGKAHSAMTKSLDNVQNPRLSRNGRSVAVVIDGDVWRYDLDGRPPLRLTFDGSHHSPLWTPDGTRLVYEAGPDGLATVLADGSSEMPEPASPRGHFHPHGWTRNGREIVALRYAPSGKGLRDLVRFSARPDGRIETVLGTRADEGWAAAVSPDGRWLAYVSDATGREEVWVRPVSGGSAAVRVSSDGGAEPLWARSGQELFYLAGSELMVVPVDALMDASRYKRPVSLFNVSPYTRSQQPPSYDVAEDGRFLMIKADAATSTRITVVVDWAAQLRDTASH